MRTFAGKNKKMTMKKTFFVGIAVTALMALTACSEKKERVRGADDFAIEGTIGEAEGQTVYLQRVTASGATLVDSAALKGDGHFAFYGPRPKGPEIYRLNVGSEFIYVSIDSVETVTIEAKYSSLTDYKVTGSDNSLKIQELALLQARLQKRVQDIELTPDMYPGPMRDSLLTLIHAYKKEVSENYILVGPEKPYAYFALFQTLQHANGGVMTLFDAYDPEDLWAFGAVATSWKLLYPESENSKELEELTLAARNELRRRNMPIDNSIIEETSLLDLALPDATGSTKTLSELLGKVVILNFHDFKSSESGAIILALRELYGRYHDQGLEIYQVGVNGDAHWWRQSVESLPWINVIDPSGASAARYNVQSLGEFFIIDRSNTLQHRVNNMADLERHIKKYI